MIYVFIYIYNIIVIMYMCMCCQKSNSKHTIHLLMLMLFFSFSITIHTASSNITIYTALVQFSVKKILSITFFLPKIYIHILEHFLEKYMCIRTTYQIPIHISFIYFYLFILFLIYKKKLKRYPLY